MKQNNKGLTLIELVVTIAIIAIFSGVVLSIIGSGSNMYRSTSSNAKVQMETQQTLDTLQNLVIDANRSVYYATGSGENRGGKLDNDIDRAQDVSGSKTFLVCNVRELSDKTEECIYDIVDWDADNQKLYYSQKKYEREKTDPDTGGTTDPDTPSAASALSGEAGDDSSLGGTANGTAPQKAARTGEVTTIKNSFVMAENLTDFRVDVEKVESERIVRFQITENVNGKEIETLHTVNLRNQIQVAEPDVAFDQAPPSNASIKIINAPEELKAGSVRVLDKYVVGDVILSTVRWHVLPESSASGSFTEADPTYGQLTVGDKAGNLVVQVTAQTTSGETVSDKITILITNDVQTVGMIADNTELLLGAGNNYDLNDLVKWYELYNDETQGTEPLSVEWSGGNSYVKVNSEGTLAISPEAGKTENVTEFVVSASGSNAETMTGAVSIKIARIDLVKPVGVYRVGEEKPLKYNYFEGGIAINNVSVDINAVQKPSESNAYVNEERFEEKDIGNWTIQVYLNLADRDAVGIVKSDSSFIVKNRAEPAEIYCNERTRTDTIFAGGKYSCAYYNKAKFFIEANFDGNYKYDLTWEIKGQSDPSTRLTGNKVSSSTDSKPADLFVGNNEKGFILSANLVIYKDSTDIIYKEYEGSLNVKVVTGLEIVNPPDRVYLGGEYKIKTVAVVSSITDLSNGGYDYIEEQVEVTNYNNLKTTPWYDLVGGNIWKVSEAGKVVEISATAQDIPKAEPPVSETAKILSAVKKVTVEDSLISFEINEMNSKTSILKDESAEFWASLKVDGQEVKSDLDVVWGGDLNGEIGKLGRRNTKFVLAEKNKNQIKVTASINYLGGKFSDECTVKIVNYSIKILSNVFELYPGGNESYQFTAQVYNDEDTVNGKPCRWSFEWLSDSRCNIDLNSSSGLLKLPKEIDKSCVLKVKVALNEDSSVQDSKTIYIYPREPKYFTYYLGNNDHQNLDLEEEHSYEQIKEISVNVLYTNGATEAKDIGQEIPAMNVNFAKLPISVQMHSDVDEFTSIGSINITLEFVDAVYYYRIIPTINNNLYNLDRNDNYIPTDKYVPAPTTAIQNAALMSDSQTYRWKNRDDETFDIRQSRRVDTALGITILEGESSKDKWFMKYSGKYYKYTNSGWYEFKCKAWILSWKYYWDEDKFWYNWN